MQLHQIDFVETKRFSAIFLDYLDNKKELQKHYTYPPTISSFENAIANRNFNDHKRDALARVLLKQYHNIEHISPSLSRNLALLKEPNTFTITTGHQLNIFTGPLFFIYKIVAVINMTKALKIKYPTYNFVPVYWMASEDHDFEEISDFTLFGKKYVWNTTQQGPVGRFDPRTIKTLLEEIPECPDLFANGYLTHNTLSEATRYIVNSLFGKYGLVSLDADDRSLKAEFQEIIQDDLFNNEAHRLTRTSSSVLEGLGYKSQIFPRPVNFFYMEDGLRERIEKTKGNYEVLRTELSFTKKEIEEVLSHHPDKFSPNVVMRPVYQEKILPNLAYVGGPAEVSYWLQLKDVFDHYDIPFPILFPRCFAMILSKAVAKKVSKLQLELNALFEDYGVLKERILYQKSKPDHLLDDERMVIEEAFESIQSKASKLDRSLEGFVLSEFKKVEKGIMNIRKRLKKAEEQKEATRIKQLAGILDKLFPNGNPQEREDNFLNFYINNPNFIDDLINVLDPFELKYNVLTEDV